MPDILVLPQTAVSYNKFTQEYSRLKRTLIELLQTCYDEYKHIFVNILIALHHRLKYKKILCIYATSCSKIMLSFLLFCYNILITKLFTITVQ